MPADRPEHPPNPTHRDRIRQGHARQRHQAHPPPGRAPYGYRRGHDRYIIDRQAAPVVRALFERFSIYGSLQDVVRYLDRQFGKRISTTTARRWLSHPVYRGDLRFGTGKQAEIIRDTHAPLISRDEAAQVDRLLKRNRQLAPRSASAPRALAGLVRCATCQTRLRVTSVRPRHPATPSTKSAEYCYLSPIACPQTDRCPGWRYEAVLEQTIAQLCDTFRQQVEQLSETALAVPQAIAAQLTTVIAQKQAVLEQLPDLLAQGILDEESLALRSYNLRREIADLAQQQAQLPPVNLREIAATLSHPLFWADLTEPERRFYLREFVQEILIDRVANDDRAHSPQSGKPALLLQLTLSLPTPP